MIIGIPVELKSGENKIALVPSVVKSLTRAGHQVLVQKNAGIKAGFSNEDYSAVGAQIVSNAEQVYSTAQLIVKINQPQVDEYDLLQENQMITAFFKYSDKDDLMQTVIDKKITTIDYSEIKNCCGNYPIMTIGSEIVGKTLVRIASSLCEKYLGGTLLGGAAGVPPSNITIIGAGLVGFNAAKTAVAIGADVSVLDVDPEKLRQIEKLPGRKIKTYFSNRGNLEHLFPETDILICAVKRNAKKHSAIVCANDIKLMKKGAIIIDAGLSSGNTVVETLDRVLSIDNPVYEKDGIFYYCAADIASTAAKTISTGMSGVLDKYIQIIADNSDIIEALKACPDITSGVITYDGNITDEKTAELFGEHVYELSMLTGF